jgi:DNA mismatch repair protein MutL
VPVAPSEAAPVAGFFGALRYIGQLDNTFLLCERAGELILVDQHAAHERVVYERLRARQNGRAVSSQPLLFPETLEVDAGLAAAVETYADELTASGFVLEPFGESTRTATLALKATPAGLRDAPAVVLRELLSELSELQGSRALEERLDLVLATVACHSSVRAGDVLSREEVLALFAEIDRIEYRAHCPHGRPVLLRISLGEIARRFGR